MGGVLRLGIGRAQIERFGRAITVRRRGTKPGNPTDIGGAAIFDQQRWIDPFWPGSSKSIGGGTNEPRRSSRGRPQCVAYAGDARTNEGTAASAEHLDKHVLVARIDRRHHLSAVVFCNERSC